jgi:glucose-6-phosphate isomerase
MMTLQIATVLCGLALDVNPLDQPGVERGKTLTYRALGRPGYK